MKNLMGEKQKEICDKKVKLIEEIENDTFRYVDVVYKCPKGMQKPLSTLSKLMHRNTVGSKK